MFEVMDWLRDLAIAGIFALLTGCVRIYFMAKELLKVHSHPETGLEAIKARQEAFGRQLEGIQTSNEQAAKDLLRETQAQTHYLKWMAENNSRQKPPPPLEEDVSWKR